MSRHPFFYSWRNDSVGLSFAALFAGSIPNMMPLTMENRNAPITPGNKRRQ